MNVKENEKLYWSHDESGCCGMCENWEEMEELLESDPLVSPISKDAYDQRIKEGFDHD